MTGRFRSLGLIAATATFVGVGVYLVQNSVGIERQANHHDSEPATSSRWAACARSPGRMQAASESIGSNRTYRVRSGQVLAAVNGHDIKVEDVWPVSDLDKSKELEVSPATYQYFLDRAVNRELIFQAAGEMGLKLSESQKAELAHLKAMRRQAEPGRVERLNTDPAQTEFELRDAEAFMLQTSLLAAKGASPNVTEDQMLNYYQEHRADFGNLPDDVADRRDAWSQISFQIRERLAERTRASFNQQLTAYMNEIKSSADIVLNQ